LPDRLQQAVAAFVRSGRGQHHQGLVDQVGEELEGVEIIAASGDGFGGVDVEAFWEHRQPAKHGLLLAGEEVVAPIDHAPQGLVAGGTAPGAATQEPKPVVETAGQLVRPQEAQAGRRELEGEWESVESAADVRHRNGGLVGELESGVGGAGALAEQRDGVGSVEIPCAGRVRRR
jgi:hypothetical protein